VALGFGRLDAGDAPATVRHAGDGCTQYLAPVEFAEGERLVAVLDAARVAALFARSLA
jgi:hypothetical protein